MDIEQRALELVKQHGGQYGPALEAAIEAHDAFRQEVSEFALGAKEYMASVDALTWQQDCDRFIIQPKTDPLVEALTGAWKEAWPDAFLAEKNAAVLAAALKSRGLEIREVV